MIIIILGEVEKNAATNHDNLCISRVLRTEKRKKHTFKHGPMGHTTVANEIKARSLNAVIISHSRREHRNENTIHMIHSVAYDICNLINTQALERTRAKNVITSFFQQQ